MKGTSKPKCRSCLVWVLSSFLAMTMGCGFRLEDQAGVTSTGNAGEIAGILVKGQDPVSLSRIAAGDSGGVLRGIPYIWVYRSTSNGRLLDSVETDGFGLFRFAQVPSGNWNIHAVVQGDTANLISVQVQSGESVRVQLVVGGHSSILSALWTLPSPFSSGESADSMRIALGYKLDNDGVQLRWFRTPRGVCGQVMGEEKSGLLQVRQESTNLWLRNAMQPTCPEFSFFSTVPDRLEDNTWYLNGHLGDLLQELPAGCSEPLPLLPEVLQAGMQSLVLHWDVNNLFAELRSEQWCLARDSRDSSGNFIFAGEAESCNGYSTGGQSDEYHEFIAIDHFAAWEIQMRQREGEEKCRIEKGPSSAFSGCSWILWPPPCE